MKPAQRWGWIVSLVAATGATLVLAFVLSFGTAGGGFYEKHFVWLFWVNVAVAALLAVVILLAAVRLVVRVRRRKFGSRLLIKLAGIFALVGLGPGLVIYTVSYQFVSRSIEAWFDVKVAGALDAGLALGKATLDTLQADVVNKTRLAAERVAPDVRSPGAPLSLERLREQFGLREASILGAGGQLLYITGASASQPPERPGAALLRQARLVGFAAQIEGLDEDTVASVEPNATRVRALARVPETGIVLAPGEERWLMVVQPVPHALARNALAVQNAYSEYQQRALSRDSLSRMYIGTLTLALVLSVFGAVLLAILLGNQLAKPLLLLADGVRQVAAGDLQPKPVFASADELGGLTRSFAAMTAQLADAKSQVERGVAQMEGARTRLQTILDTLTAGVIVFDREGRIDTVNPGATRILRLPLAAWHGRRLAELPELQGFAKLIEQRHELLTSSPEAGERDHWQDAVELDRGEGDKLTLLVRGAPLPGEQRLVVFDDITEVVSAQRSAAWAEVARRLAHEIRNPLTPIQLSAERLQHKLEARLEGGDQALLKRSVATIVSQVHAMQKLVNEFRDYARLPRAQLVPLDLNALVTEVLGLYGQALDRGVLSAELAEHPPRVMGDATQLRQVIHNLVQNAMDAIAERADGHVKVITWLIHDDHGALKYLRLSVQDNGPGFPEKVLKRAFEPYVTTKAKGTGLGLAVVRKIADDHGARLRALNLHEGDREDAPVIGARVSLSFSTFAPAAPGPEAPDAPAPATGDTRQAH